MTRLTPIFIALLLPISSASAGLVTYDSRDSWLAALGAQPDLAQDFNSITEDSVFAFGPSNAGFLSFEASPDADGTWRIDAPNNAFTEFEPLDNSTFAIVASMLIASARVDTRISFEPLKAIGFDYSNSSIANASNGLLTTSLGDEIVMSSSPATRLNFLGLVYDAGESFTSLTLSSLGNYGFGMDNVEALLALESLPADGGAPPMNPVPVPAALWLFLSALLGLFGFGKAKPAPRR